MYFKDNSGPQLFQSSLHADRGLLTSEVTNKVQYYTGAQNGVLTIKRNHLSRQIQKYTYTVNLSITNI